MAVPIDPKQIVTFEELILSQVIQLEALTRLLIEKGIFTEVEFFNMVKALDQERKKAIS